MKNILSFIWQLPQHIVALTIIIFLKPKKKNFESLNVDYYFINSNLSIGVSLGKFIFFSYTPSEFSIKHECGHRIQSSGLGWLYLIIIGIPSITGNIIDRLFHKKWNVRKRFEWYYNLPWEKDANKKAGIN